LLRLAQGDVAAAAAAMRRALAEATDRPLYRVPGRESTRSQLLPAYVETMIAGGDLVAAEEGAAELAVIAEQYGTTALHARAALARGAVHLARDEADLALPALRRAHRLWHDLGAPYEAARVRVHIAQACRSMHDDEGATLELSAARQVFALLDPRPDLARIAATTQELPYYAGCGLSRRDVDALGLILAARSNRAIAAELVLSEKTVHRHVSNIFTKLRVGSRTAAVAYAFEHGITDGKGVPLR